MSESPLDAICKILWYCVFVTSFIAIPIVLKYSKLSLRLKIVSGFGLSLAISFILLFLTLAIAFRNGMGPT